MQVSKGRIICAYLDLLGVKELDVGQCSLLLEDWRDINQHALSTVYSKLLPQMSQLPPIQMFHFADTVLLFQKFDDAPIRKSDLTNFAMFIGVMFRAWLFKGYLLRGAVSVGDYVLGLSQVDSNMLGGVSLLGSAVNAAAKHYEKVDWGGVVLCPNEDTQRIWSSSGESASQRKGFVRYKAPYKSDFKDDKGDWALAWPIDITTPREDQLNIPSPQVLPSSYASDYRSDIRERLSDLLQKNQHKGAEVSAKYMNTLSFFDACVSVD